MTTSSLRTNINNDLFLFDGRNLELVNNIEACAQDVRSRTLMRLGEDIYDVTAGVGYFEFVFTPQQNYDAARKSLIDAISSSPDVVSIDSLDIQVGSGIFNFQAVVSTLHGRTRVTNS
jgi:hypothetical protein